MALEAASASSFGATATLRSRRFSALARMFGALGCGVLSAGALGCGEYDIAAIELTPGAGTNSNLDAGTNDAAPGDVGIGGTGTGGVGGSGAAPGLGGFVSATPDAGGVPEPMGEGGGTSAVGVDLCAPCGRSRECGATDDYCVYSSQHDEAYCGRVCEFDSDCPIGYRCGDLSNAELDQCMPLGGSCLGSLEARAASVAELRSLALEEINRARSAEGLEPFTLDQCMTIIAQQAAAELSQTRNAHGKFERECAPVSPDCECNWQSEIQGRSNGVGISSEEATIGPIQDLLESTEGPRALLLEPDKGRIGIGIVTSGDELVFSFDFPR